MNIFEKKKLVSKVFLPSLWSLSLSACGPDATRENYLSALSPRAVGTSSTQTPSSGSCNGIDFGSFNYDSVSDTEIKVDLSWKQENTIGIWFFASEGSGAHEVNGVSYRTTGLRVHRKAFKEGCQAFLKAREILASRPDLIPLVKTASVFRETISRGSSNISSHAWGLAIDINSRDFPYGVANSDPNSPNAILWREVFSKAGFRWGNDFPNVGSQADPMHFEIHVKKQVR